MTDSEIIKELENCKNSLCVGCRFGAVAADCLTVMTTNVLDIINRQNTEIEQLEKELEAVKAERDEVIKQSEWIPVESEPTEPDYFAEYEFVITSPLPDFGQEILVTDGKSVWCDTFYDDDGCYTDGGYNFGTDIIAWMPLPYIPKEYEIDDEP